MASLIFVTGPNEGDYYPLGTRAMVVGRDEAVPIQTVDELISRGDVQIPCDTGDQHHDALEMGGANGVFINSRRISDDVALEDGDMIELGKSRIMFTDKDFEDRESALNHYKQRGERGKSTLMRK